MTKFETKTLSLSLVIALFFFSAAITIGYLYGGWRGTLTAFLSAYGALGPLSVALRRRRWGADPTDDRPRGVRVVAGIAALALIAGVAFGGWRLGWLWGGLGYVGGGVIGAVIVGDPNAHDDHDGAANYMVVGDHWTMEAIPLAKPHVDAGPENDT